MRIWHFLNKPFLSTLLTGLLILPAQSQEEQAAFVSKWHIGPAFKFDGWAFGPHPLESHDSLMGLQVFYRMEPAFGTGASLLFTPQDSNFEFNLDARWIWPLIPAFEPYAGLQLGYLTRSTGGLSLSFRPGLLTEVPGLPLQADLYGLLRYDIKEALFGSHDPNQLMLGIGIVLQYML